MTRFAQLNQHVPLDKIGPFLRVGDKLVLAPRDGYGECEVVVVAKTDVALTLAQKWHEVTARRAECK